MLPAESFFLSQVEDFPLKLIRSPLNVLIRAVSGVFSEECNESPCWAN